MQPTLPNPVPLTDMEQAYLEDEPGGLFPPNQDSNFGQYRKILTETFQDVANQIELLLNENFVNTSTEFLSFHEEEAGLPSLLGETIQYRQSRVRARIQKGMFTRSRRNAVIESFIAATAGSPAVIGGGIPIGSGVALYSGTIGDPKNYYKVTEDIINFYYYVYIDESIGVDMMGLNTELERITPGGIGFQIFYWSGDKTGGGKSSPVGGGIKA